MRDLFTRAIVGQAIHSHMKKSAVLEPRKMAEFNIGTTGH